MAHYHDTQYRKGTPVQILSNPHTEGFVVGMTVDGSSLYRVRLSATHIEVYRPEEIHAY